MPSWISDIQGYTTILDANGDPVQRRKALQVLGATVSDNGTHTIIEVPPGPTGPAADPALNYTWTGVHEFNSAFRLGSQQNYSGSLPANIVLSDTANRLYILVSGDGEIQTITPNDGSTEIGRIVIVYFVGSGSKTIRHSFSGGGHGRLLCPNNVDLVVGNRDSLILVGDGGNGWLVTAVYAQAERLGRLLRAPQVLTGGTSIDHPVGTRLIKVRGVGGGGAGGGRTATQGSGGSQGSSGTYGERTFTAGATSSTYVVGAAGAGVSGAAGGAGGNSTFTHAGTTVTLPGGPGGTVMSGGTSVAVQDGGGPAPAATNADWSIQGQDGGRLVRPISGSTFAFHIGPGGSNPLGSGAAPEAGFANGNAASGFGAGGGGDIADNQTNASPGTNGTAGVWIVEEYS